MLTPTTLNSALAYAAQRGILPSLLGSAGQRLAISKQLRSVSVFSARTGNAHYLTELHQAVVRLLAGGYNNDLPQLRLELKRELQALGYTPETGFPGDLQRGIPPAEPGSLQDLSSLRRLTLILETQRDLMQGAMRKAEGTTELRMQQFPAWELVRVQTREQPRGGMTSGSDGWPTRWQRAHGPKPVQTPTGERLIALKTDPVWSGLGDSSLYNDCLDVDHPPFAFRSGYGWIELHHSECTELGVKVPKQVRPKVGIPGTAAGTKLLQPDIKAALQAALKASENLHGKLTIDGILLGSRKGSPTPPAPAPKVNYPQRPLAPVLAALDPLKKAWPTLTADLKAAEKTLTDLLKDASATAAQKSAAAVDVASKTDALRQLREQGRTAIEVPSAERGKVRVQGFASTQLQSGMDIVQRYTAAAHMPLIQEQLCPAGEREHHSLNGGISEIWINRNTTASTTAHEIGHAVERQNPSVLAAMQALLAARTKGETAKQLSVLLNDPAYDASEVALEDEWAKRGGHHYCGKVYAHASTELLSMGMERLHKDPVEFALADPDYFRAVLTALQDLTP